MAYPDSVANPIHLAAPALAALAGEIWDTGNDYYPPSSLQISNIQSGTGATNVVPGELTALFNIRFNTEQTEAGLRNRIEEIFQPHDLDTEFQWQLSGPPFLTVHGALTAAVQSAIREETGLETELSTSGGTSDGRFISPWDGPGEAGVEVVELGPINATIHKINECVAINDLEPLANIYEGIAARLLEKVGWRFRENPDRHYCQPWFAVGAGEFARQSDAQRERQRSIFPDRTERYPPGRGQQRWLQPSASKAKSNGKQRFGGRDLTLTSLIKTARSLAASS